MEHQFTLPAASDEQTAIVKAIADYNVVVDAVAGSGKSTTVLHIAKEYPDKNILLLTYNAKLRLETREKCELAGIDNLEVQTYHSFCVRYLDNSCFTDQGIIKNLNKELRNFHFDALILDESQDITKLYFQLVKKIMDRLPDAWMCIIGDRYQSIYGFNGSDQRFIVFANKLFSQSREWKHLKLSTSYRVTNQMAAFLNNTCLGSDRLNAVKDGPNVQYIRCDYNGTDIMNELKNALKIYAPGDIFILAPSVRSKSPGNPARILSNKLSDSGIPVYVPINDDQKLDPDVLCGKLVFSTYHSAKGLERACTFVCGFDTSYYAFYNKSAAIDKCSNELYVAMTRAKERLIIFQMNNKEPFMWLNKELLPVFADVKGDMRNIVEEKSRSVRVGVTDLLRHQTSIVINKCMALVEYEQIAAPGDIIDIPCTVDQYNSVGDLLVEEISDVNGSALPAAFEYMTTGNMTIANELKIKINELTPELLLEIANKYNASVSGFKFKVNQISDYNWLEQEMIDLAVERLSTIIHGVTNYEVGVGDYYLNKEITGRIDAVSDDVVYEFKATKELTPEHILQLAVYAQLYGKGKKYILFNILTGEMIEVKYNERFSEIIKMLVCGKYHNRDKLSDEQFFNGLGCNVMVEHRCLECEEIEG